MDMLCLDKTGTITGKMQVEAVLPLTETYSEAITNHLTSYITHSEDKNPTAQNPFAKRSKGQGCLSCDLESAFL